MELLNVRRSGPLALLLFGVLVPANAAGPITLAVPGRSNANVSMAADGSLIAVVWSAATAAGETDIYAATSRDSGATFSSPTRVNSRAGEASVNGEQAPRVALVRRGGGLEMAVLWTAKHAAGTALLTARSTDAGRTFSPASPVPGTDAPGNRGWEAIGSDGTGRVHAVWLDHRRLAEQDSRVSAMHHHGRENGVASMMTPKPNGLAMAQLSQLYFATLDGSSPSRPVTESVCYCCKTAIASGGAGGLYLAWRHVYPGNIRDIAFTSSTDGGRTFAAPIRVSEDRWTIDGCPEDGPAMTVDRLGRVHVIWPTVLSEHGEPGKALFHAMSQDGRSFSARERIPTDGVPRHPQLAIGRDGAVVVVWDEGGDGMRRIASAYGVAEESGRLRFQRRPWSGSEPGVYPAIAATDNGLLAAWTTGPPATSVIRVRQFERSF